MKMIDYIDNPARLSDLVALYVNLPLIDLQELLETVDPLERLKKGMNTFLGRDPADQQDLSFHAHSRTGTLFFVEEVNVDPIIYRPNPGRIVRQSASHFF